MRLGHFVLHFIFVTNYSKVQLRCYSASSKVGQILFSLRAKFTENNWWTIFVGNNWLTIFVRKYLSEVKRLLHLASDPTSEEWIKHQLVQRFSFFFFNILYTRFQRCCILCKFYFLFYSWMLLAIRINLSEENRSKKAIFIQIN